MKKKELKFKYKILKGKFDEQQSTITDQCRKLNKLRDNLSRAWIKTEEAETKLSLFKEKLNQLSGEK